MTGHAVWRDGEFAGAGVVASAFDGGVRRGESVFESFAGAPGRLALLELHASRLSWAASRLGCLPLPPVCWRFVFEELLARARLSRARCRVTLHPPGSEPRLVCTVEPLRPDPSAHGGVALATSPFRRTATDPTGAIKTASRAFHRVAVRHARASGADDALLLGPDGEVLETTRCNVFVVTAAGDLATPALNDAFLPGIAREVLLRGLRRTGVRVRERTLLARDLREAPEVFVTNAVRGALPVRSIDGSKVRCPGQIERWRSLLRDEGMPLEGGEF